MSRLFRGTLARRLFALGMLQLALAIGTAVIIGALTRPALPTHFGPPPGTQTWDPFGPPQGPPGDPFAPGLPPGGPFGPQPPHHWIPPHYYPSIFTFGCGLIIIGLGAYLTARWLIQPLDQLAAAARALGSGDLSARSGLSRPDEIGQVGRAFDDMAGRIRGLLLSEKELLANVSHELRTPIARIRVALDLASEGDAEAVRLSLGEITTDLGELELLIDDILTTTRLELGTAGTSTGAFNLHREDLEASAVAVQAIERFRRSHPARPLELVDQAAAARVEVDPMLFRRVLDNLIENAHKYSPEPESRIALSVRREGRQVLFEVRDQGLGIPPDDLPHVFTPFFRGERSRDRRSGGVGLGLTLARRIVEAHGGTIALSSAPGVGTAARVLVPLSGA